MRAPRSRRALLASAVPLTMTIAGCFEGRLTGSDDTLDSAVIPADAYDCEDVDRPEPDTPTRNGALEPATYPDRPESLIEETGKYVREFEEAYRLNDFIERYNSQTESFDFTFENGQTDVVEAESDREAMLGSVVYTLSKATRENERPTERNTRVTYYVDENVVLRAEYNGIASNASIDPDPRTSGDPVACFE